MSKDKVFFILLCLILLCLGAVMFKYNDKELMNNKKAVDTFEKNNMVEDNPIILSWHKENQFYKVNMKTKIVFTSKLKDNFSEVENVVYIMNWTRDGEGCSDRDITLTYEEKEINGLQGKYEITRESRVNKEEEYSIEVLFKKDGNYKLKIYAENYKN